MRYRKFGKLDWQVSALGLSCTHLPTGKDSAGIDEAEAVHLIRYAIDHGVNYVDACNYHRGNNERVVGLALQEGYRGKVKLAVRLSWPLINSPEDCDRMLDEQLHRLRTNHVDVYLLAFLTGHADSWPRLRDLGVLDWAEGAIADGRIGCLGFSFLDDFPTFQEIVDAYDGWAMCQIPPNYVHIETQAATESLQYAASKGLGVAIMGPLLGGSLANPPQAVQEVWDSAPVQRTPVEWALHWLWDQPEVSVVLSGMGTVEQVEQNVASASASSVGSFTPAERALIARVWETYRSFRAVPCTQCGYCMPCPNDVDIPSNFHLYNYGLIYADTGSSRFRYNQVMAEESRAVECTQCRECEPNCPQQIEISEWMPQVHAVLGEGQPHPE